MRKKETVGKILKLKDTKKKEIEIEVKKAHTRADEERSRLQSLEKDYNERLQYFRENHGEGEYRAKEVIAHFEMLNHLDEKITAQRKVHSESETILQSLEKLLIEAHREKKAVEILDTKITKQQQKERALAEQKELDYLGVTRKIK